MQITDYPIKEFLSGKLLLSQDEYEMYIYALINLNPRRTIAGVVMQDLQDQPFERVIAIENRFKVLSLQPDLYIEILAICFQLDTDIIEKIGIIDFFHAYNHVEKSYKELIENENKMLAYTPEAEEVMAGIDNLSKFGRKATVNTLAGGDILKHSAIIALPYSSIFAQLYMLKVEADFKKEYHRLKNKAQ